MKNLVGAMARASKAFAAGMAAAAGAYVVAFADGEVVGAEVGFIVATGIGALLATYNVANADTLTPLEKDNN